MTNHKHGNEAIAGLDNDLGPNRRQAIIWVNDENIRNIRNS